jgi:transcriptional regulator with XRE-family HTH domain
MPGMDDVRAQSTIGERIRRLRNDVLMTQDDLAAAAGVSTDLIRKLEQGRRHTSSIGSLHRIAAALDVDLGELLGRERMPDAAPDAGVVALRQAVADVADLLGDVEVSRCRCGTPSGRSPISGVRTGVASGTSSPG